MEGFTGRIYCFTVDNVTHEIQRSVGVKISATYVAFRVVCELYFTIKNLNIVFSFCRGSSYEAEIFDGVVRSANVTIQEKVSLVLR